MYTPTGLCLLGCDSLRSAFVIAQVFHARFARRDNEGRHRWRPSLSFVATMSLVAHHRLCALDPSLRSGLDGIERYQSFDRLLAQYVLLVHARHLRVLGI